MSLWVRQAADDVWEEVVDGIVLRVTAKNRMEKPPQRFRLQAAPEQGRACTLVASSLKKLRARLVM